MSSGKQTVKGLPKVDETLLAEVVRRLVAEFDPEKIYLFGSYAWGTPGVDSDLDLMVLVQAYEDERLTLMRRASQALSYRRFSIDVLFRTLDEFVRRATVHASLEAEVVEKGRLLYARRSEM